MLAEQIHAQYSNERTRGLHRSIIEGTDTPPLSPVGSELSQGSLWIAEMFEDTNNPAMVAIPPVVRNWNTNIRRRYFEHAPNGFVEQMIVRKVFHTKNVNDKSYELAVKSPGYNWNIAQVQFDADCHDAARFSQAYFGTFDDSRSFDHALMGAAMVEFADFPYEEYGCEKDITLGAVREHSKPLCQDDPYFHILRAADKIIIAEEFITDIKAMLDKRKIARSAIDEEALEYFFCELNVPNRLALANPANRIVQRISWIYDLELHAAEVDYIQKGIPQRLIRLLKRVTGKQNVYIEQAVQDWQAKVT